MKSFDDYFNEKFPDLVEAISCGDLIAKNYKVAIKEGFDLGKQSKQQEVDELQKRIDEAIKEIQDESWSDEYGDNQAPTFKLIKILKGENHES